MQWFVKNKGQEYKILREKTQLKALECLLLANREIGPDEVEEFLNPGFDKLHDPFLFREMETAVSYILECLHAAIPIRIVGDYDQDGVAATTILIKGLRYLAEGLSLDPINMVTYAIPDRLEDGYGINKNIINNALDEGVGLIITCDNGVSAFEALNYAYEMQMPVIVTDHHRPPVIDGKEERVMCEALLNPHMQDETYPFKDLCGATVAWKLIEALFKACNIKSDFTRELLAFAALGTICDVMPLKGENRSICILGLEALNEGKNPGLSALLDAVSWNGPITVYTVGFIIGPCINASGRLMTARLGVELFIEEDRKSLEAFARELVRLNEERKEMTGHGLDKALEILGKDPSDKLLVIYIENIHESVCGLIAGRLKENYNRPCLVFTDAAEGEEGILKGSGRSIEAYHMFDELNNFRDSYISFGGHAMACGLSIYKDSFNEIKKTWQESCRLTDRDIEAEITFDAGLDLKYVNKSTMDIIEALEPYGAGNPAPLFASKNLNVKRMRLVGKNKNVLQLSLEQEGKELGGVLFSADKILIQIVEENREARSPIESLLRGENSSLVLDILYKPEWNEFNNQRKIQLIIKDMRLSNSGIIKK